MSDASNTSKPGPATNPGKNNRTKKRKTEWSITLCGIPYRVVANTGGLVQVCGEDDMEVVALMSDDVDAFARALREAAEASDG